MTERKHSPPINRILNTLKERRFSDDLTVKLHEKANKWQDRIDAATHNYRDRLRKNEVIGGAIGFIAGIIPVACLYLNTITSNAANVHQTIQIGNPNEVINFVYGIAGVALSLTGVYIGVNRGSHFTENEFRTEVDPVQRSIRATGVFLSIPGSNNASFDDYSNFVATITNPPTIPQPHL